MNMTAQRERTDKEKLDIARQALASIANHEPANVIEMKQIALNAIAKI